LVAQFGPGVDDMMILVVEIYGETYGILAEVTRNTNKENSEIDDLDSRG